MMKRILSLASMVVAVVFCSVNLTAQITVNHPFNSGATSVFVVGTGAASANYFDNGGSAGVYPNNHNNANTFVRFDPNVAGAKVQATFSTFSTEASFDALYVWDGQTIGAPKIASANGAPLANNFWGTGGWWGGVAPNNVSANVVRASNANASGSLLFGFVSDGSVQSTGWAANVITFICPTCNLTQPTNITVSASATACPGPITLNVPATSPQGCLSVGTGTLLYQYSVNGGAFETLPFPTPATFTFNNFILGVNTIVWRILDPATGCIPSQVSQTCTVNDTIPPVITCPPSITVNLAPGACCSFVTWAEPTATDNCPPLPVLLL
jgi:hypothetical protein